MKGGKGHTLMSRKKSAIDYDRRNFRLAWQLMILAVALWVLAGLYSRAFAHDPDSPEYWPRNIDWSEVNAGLDENFNTLSESDVFVFLGMTVFTCLLIALPQIFNGEYVNNMYSSYKHFTYPTGEPCVRVRLYSYYF